MLLAEFKNTVKRYNLINRRDKIVAGVSGGPDSLALLYLLSELKKEMGFGIIVAHLDHSLRNVSSLDAAFVRRVAQKLGLAFHSGKLNKNKLSGRGSVEEAARRARFDFLFQVARKTGANKIALGHNFDDQAETVLMRILRGSGLYGLGGILPKRQMAGFTLIRPLIEIRRVQIETYLKNKKLRARRDATNKKDIFFRNKIRNRLLPLMEKEYNPNIREVLTNMGEAAACDYDYLRRAAQGKAGERATKIGIDKFIGMHPALRRLFIRNAYAVLKGDLRRMSFRHVWEVEDMVLNRPQHSIVNLPQGVAAVKSKNYLAFVYI